VDKRYIALTWSPCCFTPADVVRNSRCTHKSRIQSQSKSRVWSQWKSSEAI